MLPIMHVQVRSRVSPYGYKQVIPKVVRRGWQAIGEYTHRVFRPRRFRAEHAKVANYAPRSGRYIARKLKKLGHARPLEYSGRTRLAAEQATVRARKDGVQVRYTGLNRLNMRSRGQAANMRDEFTRVIPSESRYLGKLLDVTIDKGLVELGRSPEKTYA